MARDLRIDSHKLIYHPQRVADWLEGKDIFPIYVEVGLAASCMHRCIYCAFDYLKYRGPLIGETFLKIVLEQAAEMGLKSVMFAGEGEPLMHPGIVEIISYSKMHNLDVALTTNGVLFNEKVALNALPFLSWVRFSLDAPSVDTYRRIHRCHPSHFERVIHNITRAVELKRKLRCECTIGVQALLLPQNRDQMVALADLARDLGADYLTVKPFSKHPSSLCDCNIDYSHELQLEEQLRQCSTDNFSVIFRAHTMLKLSEERHYKECLGLPFVTYIDASGDIYACSAFLGNKDFVYGNIYNENFPAIWEGEQRQRVLKRVAEMGVKGCREVCRLDEINRYLWALKYQTVPHQNFI